MGKWAVIGKGSVIKEWTGPLETGKELGQAGSSIVMTSYSVQVNMNKYYELGRGVRQFSVKSVILLTTFSLLLDSSSSSPFFNSHSSILVTACNNGDYLPLILNKEFQFSFSDSFNCHLIAKLCQAITIISYVVGMVI